MASHVNILVTGTRDNIVSIETFWNEVFRIREGYDRDILLWLYVGDCPTGLDAVARCWWLDRFGSGAVLSSPDDLRDTMTDVKGNALHVFKADWKKENRAAGPRRNIRMVKAWAAEGDYQEAVGFWTGSTERSGTLHCMSEVAKAGHDIRVVSVAGCMPTWGPTTPQCCRC